MDGKTFQEIYNILTDDKSPLPVFKKEDVTPDEDCITVLHRTVVSKDIDSITNIILDSHNHVIDLHTETDPPKSKEQLRESNKSVFDSSQDQYDFRSKARHKVLQTILKVHRRTVKQWELTKLK